MTPLLSIDDNFAKEKTNYFLAIIRNLRIMMAKEVEIMRKNPISHKRFI